MHTIDGRIEISSGDLEELFEEFMAEELAAARNKIKEEVEIAQGRIEFLKSELAELKAERRQLNGTRAHFMSATTAGEV